MKKRVIGNQYLLMWFAIIICIGCGGGGGSSSGGEVVSMSLSGTSISFGTVTVGQSSDQSFTVTNPSSSTGSLSGSVSISGAGYSIVSGGGAFSLSAGGSRTVTVRFAPTAGGSHSGSVAVTHNATNQSSPATVSLSGSGGGGGVTSISISWAANRETAVNSVGGGYRVYYATTPGFNLMDGTVIDAPYDSGPSAPTSVAIAIPPGTYYFKVVAYSSLNDNGSEPSEEATIVVP